MSKTSPKSGARILLVDDDQWAMQSLIERLADMGYEVHTAGNQSSACDMLRVEPYAALIIDCMMPLGESDQDAALVSMCAGIDLVRMIRSADDRVGNHNTMTPIVILTAISDREILSDLSSGQATVLLRKPTLATEIAEVLQEVISARDRRS